MSAGAWPDQFVVFFSIAVLLGMKTVYMKMKLL